MIKNLNEGISKVESLRDSNRLEESIDLLRQVLEQQPDFSLVANAVERVATPFFLLKIFCS